MRSHRRRVSNPFTRCVSCVCFYAVNVLLFLFIYHKSYDFYVPSMSIEKIYILSYVSGRKKKQQHTFSTEINFRNSNFTLTIFIAHTEFIEKKKKKKKKNKTSWETRVLADTLNFWFLNGFKIFF